MEPVSPESAGGFFTTEPLVKPPLEHEHREGKNCTPPHLEKQLSSQSTPFEPNDPEIWKRVHRRWYLKRVSKEIGVSQVEKVLQSEDPKLTIMSSHHTCGI